VFDLLITGGTVVDGTGADRFTADVAIKDGKIVEVRRRGANDPTLQADAAETIDATGKIVAPGFVDIHTHYDGQVSWDDLLEPSSSHGVTTIVAGNCGVGFAPVRPGREQWLIELMEGVEDIPGTALTEGITWGWETYAEYLDVIGRRELAVDMGSQIAHGTVRAYAMGERGARNEPATAEDIAMMSRIVQEAVEAGALGFSSSRTLAHRAMDGEPVPGTFAAEDELFALGRATAAGGGAVFELAPQGAAGEDIVAPRTELEWMRRLGEEIDCALSFALIQVDADPNLWREQLDLSAAAHQAGSRLYPQVAARPFGMLLGFPGHHAFTHRPTTASSRPRSAATSWLPGWPNPLCGRRSCPRTICPWTPMCSSTACSRWRSTRPTGCTRWATRPTTSPPPSERCPRSPRRAARTCWPPCTTSCWRPMRPPC
jgi:N-acyl-D-amino-acid deacylase